MSLDEYLSPESAERLLREQSKNDGFQWAAVMTKMIPRKERTEAELEKDCYDLLKTHPEAWEFAMDCLREMP
jgi:hypothetical protein